MQNKLALLIFSILILIFSSSPSFSQTGKISGTIFDDSNEPLIGASVLIEGTSLGAATNVRGEFIILNISPGTYSLKASYVGYNEAILSNVKVSVNLTTSVEFILTSTAIELGTIVKVAERPLIIKNATNTINIVRSEDIENLPLRDVTQIVATQTGVVSQDDNLYIRGSRADAVAYYVDGVLVNNPVFGGSRVSPIANAIEEIQFQAGGYSAEFGGANAGIISTQTRIGGEKYHFGLELITDNFSQLGEKFLGGYSYGFSEYVLTASGPLIPSSKKVKFFIAANNKFYRSPASFYKGTNFVNVFDPVLSAGGKADTFNVVYPDGYLVGFNNNSYQFSGNLYFDLNPFTIRLNGGFNFTEGRNGVGITNVFTAERAGVNQSQTITSSLKFTHVLATNAFYDVVFNYYSDFYLDMDPIFQHDITAYGDSLQNAKYGTSMKRDGVNLDPYQAYGFTFTRSTVPFNAYRKQRTDRLGGKLNSLIQLRHNEIKFGGEFDYWTIRRYSLSPRGIVSNIRANPQGDYYKIYDRLDNYGYDVFGNKSDEEGLYAPKHPIFAAAYLMDKIEYSDLVINFGIRFDYINTNSQKFKDPSNIIFDKNDKIDPISLEDVEPTAQFSPRLGFSFPVTDNTVFHAQYGKFIQQTQLRDIYQGYSTVADNIKGGFAISQPVGFGLKPEQTTQYEIGFKQMLGDFLAFNLTGFYKDIKDQIQIRSIYASETANHRQYYAWVNGDFSTTKGFEFSIDLRRTSRIAATLDYTYSDASGTGSNPSTGFRMIWQSPTAEPLFPQMIAPTDFNLAHKGALNIDYRFSGNDGPILFGQRILENFGMNFLVNFGSGFNFTRWDGYGNARIPNEPLNTSTTPWTFQVDARIDKTFNFGPFKANLYIWIMNLLNTQNVVSVFNNTGDAYDDGYLTDPQGIAQIEGYRRFGDDKAQLYQDLYRALTYSAGYFGSPRQIKLGIRLNY
ncbi:MAG: TonB-dependent receptor [Bacteroidetes bacterium]|nr:TonB-dependent receptor [Bacteroidota bacterium]MBU2586077.1 TonB-dependent receptor [Bacteroidota bacterium]